MDATQLVAKINALLPQTQCGKCGHPGCKPYAQAIAGGSPLNRCPPGGAVTIRALAKLLNLTPEPLDPVHGIEDLRKQAYIREAECIGCTLCIQACPVDAILGSGKLMHTVIGSECTGCDLCVAPCPVDCIDMLPAANQLPPPTDILDLRARQERAVYWQQRYEFLQARKAGDLATEPQPPVTLDEPAQAAATDAQATIAAALARVKAKKAAQKAASSAPATNPDKPL